jgi:hypothetical protein
MPTFIDLYEKLYTKTWRGLLFSLGTCLLPYVNYVVAFINICNVYSHIYKLLTPDIYFDFITRDGLVVSYQYPTCIPPQVHYDYVVYSNKNLKSIIGGSLASVVYDEGHHNFKQKVICNEPFLSSILIQNSIITYPWYSFLWYNKNTVEDPIIELKTDEYNYFINGNILNMGILKYIVRKHYPHITLTSKTTIKVLTSSYIYKTYPPEFSLVLHEA